MDQLISGRIDGAVVRYDLLPKVPLPELPKRGSAPVFAFARHVWRLLRGRFILTVATAWVTAEASHAAIRPR
jgi:hypothetical protein